MASIGIESYTVRVGRSTFDRKARITISGPITGQGTRNEATLDFNQSRSRLQGAAFNVGGTDSEGIHVVAMMPFDDFERMYDVIRNEAPVRLRFFYDDDATTTKPLRLVEITTGDEPPGEGEADAASDALIASILESQPAAESPATASP